MNNLAEQQLSGLLFISLNPAARVPTPKINTCLSYKAHKMGLKIAAPYTI